MSHALPRPTPWFFAVSVALAACSSSNSAKSGDAGAHGDTGTTSAACTALAACCHELPVAQDPSGCLTDVQVGTASACSQSLSTYQMAGFCKADGGSSGSPDGGSGGATTTIAQARQAMPTTAITVKGFVTALAGVPGDYPNWYIEDPAGGQYSGINVYCDPLATTMCLVPEPALGDLIQLTGKVSSYKGQLELLPTAMTVLQKNATPPPIPTLTAADVAPSANSPYRGVFVNLMIGTKLTVDDVTPAALADTACGATLPTDGGTGDAGVAACTNLCTPPVYGGFQANDGTGNEVYVEAPFFNTDPLQSSPECLSQPGVTKVTVGMTFSKMSGILDVDPYSGAQSISPVVPADYATP